VVVQGARSVGVLNAMQSFFGVAAVSINRRHDNHKEHLHRYTVSRREDLLRVIIPFFKAIQTGSDRNPQRPYAERPGHRAKRWSQLHGDMQGQHFSRKGAVRSGVS
jgi:hypothetical protein